MTHSGRVVIVGEMGAGKTTIGRALARVLDLPLLDSDDWIETAAGLSGGAIAERDGVEALHQLERQACAAMLELGPAVVCPAASVIEDDGLRRRLGEGFVVWADAAVDLRLRRVEAGNHRRSVDQSLLRALAQRRRPMYEAAADLVIDSGSLSVDACVARIVAELEGGAS